jgi:phage shock protein PspC (stress-responsive transcriptional regulator)
MNEHPDAQPPAGDTPPVSDTSPPPAGEDREPGPAGTPFAARYGLVRPLHGRYLGGVCAAIGRATNTDPVLWRVLLAVTSFLGIGVLIYLAGWLLIPAEGDTASPVEALLGRGRSRTSPVVVVVLGGLALLVLGFMLTDGFRGPLLIVAVVVGGVLLLSRNSERGHPQPPGMYAPPGTPEAAAAGLPTTGYAPPPAPFDAGPYATAYAAPPAAPAAAGPSAPPPVAPGYRAPFAPRGPYAPQGPPLPPYPPGANPPQPPSSAGWDRFRQASSAGPPLLPRERSRLGIFTLSLVLLVVGAVAALDLSHVVGVGPGGYLATALATVGVGLVVGAWYGRARWLIALGLVSAIGLGIASVAERVDTRNFGSDLTWRPTTMAELDQPYEQNFGSAKLDLRQIDFTGQSKAVTLRIAAGDLEVMLPPDVDTTVETEINVGDARIFDTQWSGLRVPTRKVTDPGRDGAGGGELRLIIRVNAGNVEVHR